MIHPTTSVSTPESPLSQNSSSSSKPKAKHGVYDASMTESGHFEAFFPLTASTGPRKLPESPFNHSKKREFEQENRSAFQPKIRISGEKQRIDDENVNVKLQNVYLTELKSREKLILELMTQKETLEIDYETEKRKIAELEVSLKRKNSELEEIFAKFDAAKVEKTTFFNEIHSMESENIRLKAENRDLHAKVISQEKEIALLLETAQKYDKSVPESEFFDQQRRFSDIIAKITESEKQISTEKIALESENYRLKSLISPISSQLEQCKIDLKSAKETHFSLSFVAEEWKSKAESLSETLILSQKQGEKDVFERINRLTLEKIQLKSQLAEALAEIEREKQCGPSLMDEMMQINDGQNEDFPCQFQHCAESEGKFMGKIRDLQGEIAKMTEMHQKAMEKAQNELISAQSEAISAKLAYAEMATEAEKSSKRIRDAAQCLPRKWKLALFRGSNEAV